MAFPVDPKIVEIVPEGRAGNTVDVVKRGINMQQAAEKAGQPFVHVYCVFDKDDFDMNRYQQAFIEARKRNDVTAIWANQCFELWYLLHFAYHNSGIHRNEIYKKLEAPSRLGKSYEKSDTSIYDSLLEKRTAAIRNSEKLLVQARAQSPSQPWVVNPSTNVQDVVGKLIELGDLKDATE